MNNNILFLLSVLFSSIIFSQVKSDTVNIPEIILKENSQLNFTKFNESLRYHELYSNKRQSSTEFIKEKAKSFPLVEIL